MGNRSKLDALRNRIDKIDSEILEILYSRFDVVRGIGICKKDYNVRVLQMNRWIQMRANRLQLAEKFNLSENFVDELFQLIHEESMNVQSDEMNKKV